jgi:hypothetical protein
MTSVGRFIRPSGNCRLQSGRIKTIIAGSPVITDYPQVAASIAHSKLKVTEVLTRGTPGVGSRSGGRGSPACRCAGFCRVRWR